MPRLWLAATEHMSHKFCYLQSARDLAGSFVLMRLPIIKVCQSRVFHHWTVYFPDSNLLPPL
jgi:hypothetical protein